MHESTLKSQLVLPFGVRLCQMWVQMNQLVQKLFIYFERTQQVISKYPSTRKNPQKHFFQESSKV